MKNDELNAATVERCAQVAERCEKATVREALEQIEAIETDYTAGSDANLEHARSIARAALSQAEPEPEPVAWRWQRPEWGDYWIYNPEPCWLSEQNNIIKQPLYTSPRLDRERLARALCKSGKFDTGQGTCALVCMDQLGDPRKSGCSHCITVHGALADAIMRETR